jgi:hypothetical protein
MTELYHPSTGEAAEPEADPAPDTGEYSGQSRHETTPDTDQSDTGTPNAHAAEDRLPTRQDARAATWGEDPEYDDQNDPDTGHDTDLGALTADDDYALDSDQDDLDQAAADQGAPATGPDDPPAEAPDSMAGSRAEQDERSPGGTSERITELEAENAQQANSITDLQARLERLERGNQAEPSTGITGQEHDQAQRDTAKAEDVQTQRRHRPTDEALALGAAATGGLITTVADYVPFLHADVAGIAASAVAVGAATVTWMRARREDRHADRSQD